MLGDVCGKGLEAAVLTGKIRNTVHALRPMARDHRRMLGLLNNALLKSEHTRFVTLVLASVSRRGPDVGLRLTCAGHPPPLIVRSDGRVEEAQTRGTVVGALPTIETTTVEADLAPGETCLLFTDGITEARGGPLGDDQFGEERLRRRCPSAPGCRPRRSWSACRCSPPSGWASGTATTTTWPSWRSPHRAGST